MGKKKLTSQQISEIKLMRCEGATTAEIAAKIGVATPTVSYYTADVRKQAGEKVCPACRKHMEAEANYCSRCGADIRSRKDILIEEIQVLRGLLVHLPENARAKADDVTKKIIDYLKKE